VQLHIYWRAGFRTPGETRYFLFTTSVQNGTGAQVAIRKMGKKASSRRYSDRGVNFTTHYPITTKSQTGWRYTSIPLLCLLCRLRKPFNFLTFIYIVVLNYAQRQLCLLVSITDVIQVDDSIDDYDSYDVRSWNAPSTSSNWLGHSICGRERHRHNKLQSAVYLNQVFHKNEKANVPISPKH